MGRGRSGAGKSGNQKLSTGVHGNAFAISEKINGVEINTKIKLKQLTGTEKQIKYAEDIRARRLTANADNMLDTLYRKTQSKEQQENFSQMLKNNGFKSVNDYVNQGFKNMNKNILEISSAAEIIDTSKRKNDPYWR